MRRLALPPNSTPAMEAFRNMVAADLLILGRSTFSFTHWHVRYHDGLVDHASMRRILAGHLRNRLAAHNQNHKGRLELARHAISR